MKIFNVSSLAFLGTLVLMSFVTIQGKKPGKDKGAKALVNTKDTLLYSFVVLGCNRLDKEDTAAAHEASTANANTLLRTFSDIAAMKPVPDYLFMAGDLIIGYSADTSILARELRAWRTLYENSSLSRSSIKLVALPGNHEVMRGKKKPAYEGAESIWTKIMAPYIIGDNGPHAGGVDSLKTDQSKLTYSFNYKNSHFVMLNTDPVGHESGIPAKWVSEDISTAKAKGAKHIFAIGHKPAFPFDEGDGLNNNDRYMLWYSMERNRAEAMITAHNHVYYKIQPNKGKTWQIIAGNGGSTLSDKVKDPKQKFFGYTLISVYTNGKVICNSYGRDLPAAGYYAKTDKNPTTIRDSVDLTFH